MLEKLLLRPLLFLLLKLFFRVELRGVEHHAAAGNRALIICNHLSFLDPLILGVFLPKKPAFAINIFQAEKWYFRWLDKIATLYRLDPSKPLSMKKLIQDLRRDGHHVVIFPEGRITTTGGLMKIYDGTGMIAEKTGATVLPVRIDGAEYSKVSRLSARLRQRWFPKVTLTFLPPRRFEDGQEASAQAIYDIMSDAAFDTFNHRRTVLQAVLDAMKLHGPKHSVACDVTRTGTSYRQLFTRAFILSGKLSSPLDKQEYVGLMLPSSVAAMVTFTALHILGKVPCMLNFSAGPGSILHACRIARVQTVLTSRAFIEKGKLEELMITLEKEYKVIYLEDIRPTVTLLDKLRGLCRARCPRSVLEPMLEYSRPDDPAVILYTSGSEGMPKGVALSHANILANIAQACSRLDLTTSDRLFNAMPVFHSFGLTIGMILPMLRGIMVFQYPSPLHYRVIPDLMYDTDATVMLGTDTFYNGYARYAHPYDFFNIRIAVAGAEKLKDTTRQLYRDKFRLDILEGYGVTEASPVISVNTPMEHKTGTVGRPLPKIECRLDPVEGLEGAGRLLVKGPNVMLGYLKADQPGVIQPQGDWYDTGDIVALEEGFIAIKGRAKRFAKIAGEMVSLQVVEDLASGLAPEQGHAAIAIPDDRKGEQIILYTEAALTREALLAAARQNGVPEIALPKHVEKIAALPRLGTGKIDYVGLKKLKES